MSPTTDPTPILQTAFGFWASKVLMTAVEMGVFCHCAEQPLTGPELADRCGLHPRGTYDFLDALVALGFLEREGEAEEGLYSNPPQTATFLVRSSPRYIGGILEMLNARLFRFWDDLPEALRTGLPQNEIKHSRKPVFEELYADLPRLEQFLGAMAGLSRFTSEVFAKTFDFAGYSTLCDVGGATGLLACTVAEQHPRMRCSSFDLPAVEPIALRAVAKRGLSDRVTIVSGDFFVDPLPSADIITMATVLHDWSLEKKMHLIRAAHDALPDGGALVAIEHLIDDERRENAFGLLMSLNMLIELGDGFDFTGADFRRWCTEVGFKRFEQHPLAGACSMAIAYK